MSKYTNKEIIERINEADKSNDLPHIKLKSSIEEIKEKLGKWDGPDDSDVEFLLEEIERLQADKAGLVEALSHYPYNACYMGGQCCEDDMSKEALEKFGRSE